MRACPLVALLLGLVGFLATGCAGSPTPTPVTEASTCVFRGTPNIVLEVGAPDAPGSRRLAVWDIPNDPALWTSQKPSSDALDTFLDEVGRRVGDTSPATLLTRAAAPPTSPREIELNQWLLQNLERLVVPMRCFDAILLARQAERLDMISSPTEVLAFVLRSEDHRRLKVIEYTVNQPGIGRVGPIMDEVDKAIAAGWRPWSAFHNHNFFFEDGAWRGGSVAPSAPDAELMSHLHSERGLEQAWITNGLSTSIAPLNGLDR
jgi:hypothetical protein